MHKWLYLLLTVFTVTPVIALVNLIIAINTGEARHSALPLGITILISLSYILLIWEPFRFVTKGATIELRPRWIEVITLVILLIGTALLSSIGA